MGRHDNRCANSEALARHERETDKAEEIYEQNCKDMNEELDELIEQIGNVAKKYELQDEAREYVKDMV